MVYQRIKGDIMGFQDRFQHVLSTTNALVGDYLFKCCNRKNASDFSREGKMGFKETVFFMLNMVKKSLQVELNSFFETVLSKDCSVTKQAYSEARQKIEPKVFIELNDKANEIIYGGSYGYELWNGYRLSAIDGSVIELPNTELLKKEFGYIENQNSKVARARASCIFDVLNKIVIKSKIDIYKASERDIAKELILEMLQDGAQSELILFDRGYPGVAFFKFLNKNGVNFVMRAKVSFSNDIKNARKPDQIITMKSGKDTCRVRVVRFMLPSGIEEVLITSLFNEKYTIEDFKDLYFRRWNIEVKFDELKNRLEIENFTGTTKIAIEQDFYASIYLSNMIELAKQESDELIKENNKEKTLKYEYQTNLNMLVGGLKDKLILMMLEKNNRKRNKMYKNIMLKASQNAIPIRLDRHNPRKKTLSRGKYSTNHKRCL